MGFAEFLAVTLLMGLSIFLSLPLVLRRSRQARTTTLLGALAIGILVFLLADIFGDVLGVLASRTNTYLTDPVPDLAFVGGVLLAFLFLYLFESREGAGTPSARRLAIIIAVGMAFQNLTEGLVFGVAWSAGTVGLEAVVFLGFVIQNITEGFPIGAPFFGESERPAGLLASLFFLAGITTVLGGVIGYFHTTVLVEVFFDALAIGAILYVLVPMLRGAFRPLATPEAGRARDRLVYLGLLGGFLLGFLVNAI